MAWIIDIQEREIQGIDYGFDVSGVDDISKSFTTSKELRLLAEALLRRLITGKGTLFCDLTYGYDLRMLLNSNIKDFEKANIVQEIQDEIASDDRVSAVKVEVLEWGERIRMQVNAATVYGPLDLTALIDSTRAIIERV